MITKILKKVEEIARGIVEENCQFYTQDMVQLMPQKILRSRLTSKNIVKVSEEIDTVRFKKEQELARMSGIMQKDESLGKLKEIINNEDKFKKLSLAQQRKVREIKFLFNVAATVVHQ